MSFLLDLECGACGKRYDADELHNLCPSCSKPLLARYDLGAAAAAMTPEAMAGRGPTMWRYREMLPVQ